MSGKAVDPLHELIDLSLMQLESSAGGGQPGSLVDSLSNVTFVLEKIEERLCNLEAALKIEYSKKFPELCSASLSRLNYAKTLLALESCATDSARRKLCDLEDFLPAAQVMIVSTLSSARKSVALPASHLQICLEQAREILHLESTKERFIAAMEQSVATEAPNLCSLVGRAVAAALIAVVGGVAALAKIPANNIQVLGYKKQPSSIGATQVHSGILLQCSVVLQQPKDFQLKACRLFAAKCAMAARIDAYGESKDGSAGGRMRSEVEGKLAKAQEARPYKEDKPLPKPIDAFRKKRGGRRVRKFKELLAVTQVRRKQNRVSFNVPEKEILIDDEFEGMGQLDGTSLGLPADARLRNKIKKDAHKNKVYSAYHSLDSVPAGTGSLYNNTGFDATADAKPAGPAASEKSKSKWF